MVEEVTLPEISENVDSGEVIRLLVSEGETIGKDQSVVELETDKAAFEVPSTVAGQVMEVVVAEGDVVNVGQVLIKVETGKEAGTEAGAEKGAEKAQTEETEPETIKRKETEDTDREKAGGEPEVKKEEPSQERVVDHVGQKEVAPASPSVRRLARELGVDIDRVAGSGPGGRISREDVKGKAKRIVEGRTAAVVVEAGAGEAAAQPGLPDFSRWGPVDREPLSKVRRITAGNMAAAWRTIPHVTQFDRADLKMLNGFRQSHKQKVAEAGGKLTVTAILLKILVSALKVFPRFNSSLDMANQQIIFKRYYHLGVAVDTDRGLLVPVIRDVDKKDITRVSVELSDLAERARNKKIKPDELEGATFTLSNLGGIGGTNFTPIVYHPQVAILGTARAYEQLAMNGDGTVEAHTILPLALSYDHRIIDGADGARFLRWIADALENPLLIVMEGGS